MDPLGYLLVGVVLGAEFLAMAQVLIYVGATIVLYLFVVALLASGQSSTITGTLADLNPLAAFTAGLCAVYIQVVRPPQQKPVMPSFEVSPPLALAQAIAGARCDHHGAARSARQGLRLLGPAVELGLAGGPG